MMKRKYITMLIHLFVLLLSWCADAAQLGEDTDNDIPTYVPDQTHVDLTISPAQLTETVSTIQETETVVPVASLITSLPEDQSESSSIKEGTYSSSQIEPSFSEVQGTSQDVHIVTESVTQSTSVDQSDGILENSDNDSGTENKKSVEDSETEVDQVEQKDTNTAADLEVKDIEKVTEEVRDAVKEKTVEQVVPDEDIHQYKIEEKEEVQKDEVSSEQVLQVPSPPFGEESNKLGGEMPGVGGAAVEVISEEKPEEEGLTFNEWTQKVLAEAEKGKQDAQDDTQNLRLPPVNKRKKKNYASQECGAKILASNPEASSPRSVLNSNRDEYMNNPCKAKKWFVIELCEPIQAHSVDIASLELFSSQPKKFRVHLSDRYPTKDWKLAGEFDIKDERAVQTFPITEAQDYFAKFVRVELLEHYGNEHFCPLTIFRVLGIAVIDYEDDHQDHVDDENDEENDENHEGEEGSKNLFTSAKDTVINIVKKVLNVESEGEKLIQNATQVNLTSEVGSGTSLNGTASSKPDTTLPCVPDANIVSDKADSCTEQEGQGHTGELPKPVLPGKTDSIIVTKLEDHEQVETTPDTTPGKFLDSQFHDIFLTMFKLAVSKKRHCLAYSKLLEFIYMIRQQSPIWQIWNGQVNKTKGQKESKIVEDIVGKKLMPANQVSDDSVLVSSSSEADSFVGKSENVVSTSTDSSKLVTKSSKVDQGNYISESKLTLDSSTLQEKSKYSETADVTLSTTSKFVKATSTEDDLAATDTQIISTTQTVESVATKLSGSTTSSVPDQSAPTETEKIEPSPTSVEIPREVTVDTSREATPVLPESWKPDTKDLMQDRTFAETQKASDSTVMIKPSLVSIQSGDTTATRTATDDSEKLSESADVSLNGGSLDDIGDEFGTLDAESGEETQEQKPNTTVIDGKVVVGNGGQQKRENLSLVRLPVIPSSKRESAIMRLSNRIKVLEQNVSLSSRFLEELSRRYKKQSEDMMKMLNKTMSSLHNMTVEADIKKKLHEDEMTAMERRLENLTQIVHKLTQNFDNLNRQVTDRQMIWTTIEIVIIIFMLLFLHFRRKKVTLPPEVRSLIESMPTKPGTTLPKRRNSLSGPATPSKEKSFGILQSGGGLQRFSSETALADADFPIVHPIETSLKLGSDGFKKKKKKKHKNLESKFINSNVRGPVLWEDWSSQFSSHQSASSSNLSIETSQPPVSKSNQSKGKSLHTSCSMPQTQSGCFGSLLTGWSSSTATKQRSASLGTEGSTGAIFTQAGGTFQQGVQEGTKDGLGTKCWTKGLTKKPPVSGGSKVSPKLNMKIPKGAENEGSSKRLETTLEEKWIKKGHKRQKSLPKQHYFSVETVGQTNGESMSPAGIHGTVKHFDTTPIPHKVQKRGEMKKSASLPTPSEINVEKTPTGSATVVNGHHECSVGKMDTDQPERFYSVAKSKSESYFASKYGNNAYNDEVFLNGYTNWDNYNKSAYSRDKFAAQGRDGIGCQRTSFEPLVVNNEDSIKPSPNGTWKNIFGFFK